MRIPDLGTAAPDKNKAAKVGKPSEPAMLGKPPAGTVSLSNLR
jgi:hypothetical protein